jgi:uncharacterized protein YjbJ (UPF0337 family)
MKSSLHDKVEGTAKQVAGKTREAAGRAAGDLDMEDRGTAQKIEGKAQKKMGDVKKVFNR